MDTLLIDPSTGHIGTSSLLQTSLTPSFHKSSIGRVIKNTLHLPSYSGPKTKKTKIGRANVFAVPLDTCIFIIDNIQGGRWATWRKNEGGEFKRALREHVEIVCSGEFQQPDHVTKESILNNDLKRAGIEGGVRVDEATGLGSSLDVINLMCPEKSEDYAAKTLSRIIAKDDRVPSIESRTKRIQINGRDHTTPVADFPTLVQIMWMLPGTASREFRRQSAHMICRVMGGDISLCRQIEQNHLTWMSRDGGEATQKALLKPLEYREEEVSNRARESKVRDALASLVGGEIEVRTPSGVIDVLSDTEVIEVKYYRQWKGGIGQILSYGSHYPLLAKRLHLFAHAGDVDTQKYFALAKSVCDAHEVEVTFEEFALVEEEEEVGLDNDDDTTVNGEQCCSRLQSSEEGRAFQRFLTGEQEEPPTKKSRIGPKILEHATDEDYESFVKTEVTHALALRQADQQHELALRNTKSTTEELQIVSVIRDAFESIRPLDDMQKIELCGKISDIQYRVFTKVSGSEVVVAEGTPAIASAVGDAVHMDPGHGVATPLCHASV